MAYNEELCKEKHKVIEDKITVHDDKLTNHVERLDCLEQDGREHKTQITNLIISIDNLVSTMKWLIGLSVPTILVILGLLLKK
jgi:hypothetical protein